MTLSPAGSRRYATVLGLLLVAVLLSARFGGVPGLDIPLQRLEMLAYDLRMQAHLPGERGEGHSPTPVVIVDIDEASLRREGHWPWPRQRIAALVDALAEAGAAVVVFDVLFAEPERNPAALVAPHLGDDPPSAALRERLEAVAPALDGDRLLAGALRERDVVLGYVFNPVDPAASGVLPDPLPLYEPDAVQRLALAPMAGYSAPLPGLGQAAAAAGFFSFLPDADGVVRRVPLLARHDDRLYGSLAVEAVRRYLLLDQVRLEAEPIAGMDHIERVWLDDALGVPTDGEGRMLVPYRGGYGSFPYLPAWEVLAGEADPDALADAIVLIGTTAPGLFDLRATPVAPVFPGVEVHANLIAAMLDNRFLVEPPWARGANLVIALLVGVPLAFWLPRVSALSLFMSTLVAAGALILGTGWLWSTRGLVLDLAAPMLLIALLGALNLGWGFFFEARTKRRLKMMFGQYVPPELVEEMSERPGDFGFAGEQRELSVLFSDIRGFTTISETLAADELKQLLNRYFTPMTRIIFEHRGTIDKYVGDMVMAFWGAPVRDPDHAAHAIEAALAMLAGTETLKREFVRLGLPEISIGIGINSGVMNVGDMGSEYRRAYTVLGDAVNLASRLEGTTKYYGVGLVVGERTRELAGERFVWRELDLVRVKGKDRPVHVYEPVCRRDEAGPGLLDELRRHDAALAAFRARRWEEAAERFAALRSEHPDCGLYILYLERLAGLRADTLPPDWDGSWTRTEK